MTDSALAHVALDVYLDWFSARRDAYVLDSHEHVNQGLDPDVCEWALTKGHSLSGYSDMLLTSDDRLTGCGAIDLDEGTLDDGREVQALLLEHSIPSLLVESRRGAHVWVFPKGDGTYGSEAGGRVPSSAVRRALTAVLTLGGKMSPKSEVFPKASTAQWGCGAVRMPLMPHPKTGERYPAWVGERAITKVLDLLDVMPPLVSPYDALRRLGGSIPIVPEYPRALGPFSRRVVDADGTSVTGALALLGVQAVPGRTIKCPFHDDHHASFSIAADDKRAFCKAPVCPVAHGDEGRGIGSINLTKYVKGQ